MWKFILVVIIHTYVERVSLCIQKYERTACLRLVRQLLFRLKVLIKALSANVSVGSCST